MYGYIYKTTNLINNKIYVGQHKTTNDNIDDWYIGSGKLLLEAIDKYGKKNFKCEVIEWCNNETELNEREIYYIDLFKSKVTFGNYNISDGGFVPRLSGELNGNYGKHRPHTEQEKMHLSKVAKGHKPTFTRKHTQAELIKMGIKAREFNLNKKDYKQVSKANTGSRFMHKGEIQCWVKQADVQQKLSEGWKFGACKKRNRIYTDPWNKGLKNVQKPTTLGKKAITNGIQNKFVIEEDIEKYLKNGWKLGLTRHKLNE